MRRFLPILVAGMLSCGLLQEAAAESPALASPWTKQQFARARLIAGGHAADAPVGTITAGVEIELADGWKTYWRNPGSSGVPPLFDWSAASNLASAEVRYPAPIRQSDRGGDTIGYKHRLIFPLVVRPADPQREVALDVSIEFGVCKDICIPMQAQLTLTIPPDAGQRPVAGDLAQALDRVPRPLDARRPSDPSLGKTTVVLSGDKPTIRLEAIFPGGAEGADIFIEAPDGLWIPMTRRDGHPKGDTASFVVDLTEADIAELKGKTMRITLVSPHGQSETTFRLD